jgi:NhaP-type Na+/H+ or K+/H+ antiporter
MAAFTFGVGLINYKYIMEMGDIHDRVRVDIHQLREFHEEITFFIKSFFFVYIGVFVSISLRYIFFGLTVAILMVSMRFFLIFGLSKPLLLSDNERILSQFVYSPGLEAFVMAQLPAIIDKSGEFFVKPGIYSNLCMPIVFGMIIFSGLVGPLLAGRELKRVKNSKTEKSE